MLSNARRASATIGRRRATYQVLSTKYSVLSRCGEVYMRPVVTWILGSILSLVVHAQEAVRPMGPEEALKRVDQKVAVLMEVKSTGGNTARYLNSEVDFRFEKNFAVFIPNIALEAFKKAGIADPGQYYKGKTIVVTGMVALSQGRPQIRVENPAQIKVANGAPPAADASKRPAGK